MGDHLQIFVAFSEYLNFKYYFCLPEFVPLEGQFFLPNVLAQKHQDNASSRILQETKKNSGFAWHNLMLFQTTK